MSKESVILTGGLGFIFSHVAEYLERKGYNVLVVDNFSEGSHPELISEWAEKPNLNCVKMDVHGSDFINFVINEEPDYIIHAAAYSDVDKSITNSYEIIKANCQANLNVFEASRQLPDLKKLVYVSTDEVYGECDHPKSEDEIIFPKNPYSFSKAHGSLLRLAYDNTYPELRNKTAETRFCNVVGERQDDRKVLPRIRECLKNNKSMTVHNGGYGYREYIWVENIPPAVELVMTKGDRVYNITNNEGYTVNELINLCEEVVDKHIIKIPSNRPGMDIQYQMDNERIRELGWRPTKMFGEGLYEYLNA